MSVKRSFVERAQLFRPYKLREHNPIEIWAYDEDLTRNQAMQAARSAVEQAMEDWLIDCVTEDGFDVAQGTFERCHPYLMYQKKSNEIRSMARFITPAGTILTYIVASYVTIRFDNPHTNV